MLRFPFSFIPHKHIPNYPSFRNKWKNTCVNIDGGRNADKGKRLLEYDNILIPTWENDHWLFFHVLYDRKYNRWVSVLVGLSNFLTVCVSTFCILFMSECCCTFMIPRSTIKGNGTYAIPGIAGLRGIYHLLRCQAVDCKWTQMSHLFSRCIAFHGSQCESTVRLSFVWLCTEAIERLSRESKTDND